MDAEADPKPIAEQPQVRDLAVSLRQCGNDHIAISLAAATAALFARHLRFDAADTAWPDRDRLFLGGAATVLAGRLSELLGATPGLAEIFANAPGQSLGAALGAALAERMMAARFGRSLVDHRIWLLVDGQELASGAAQEAAILAGQLQLGRITVIAAVAEADWQALGRFTALGWTLRRIDSSDGEAACSALSAATRSRKPTLIACRNGGPGFGLPALDHADTGWMPIGHRGAAARRAWLKRLKRHASREEFERVAAGDLPARWRASIAGHPPEAASLGTLAAVEAALQRLATTMPGLGELPHASQAIGATLVGMALHGGVLPVGRRKLQESEILRPALRLAAVLGLRVVQVLTEPENPCPAGGLRSAWRAMGNVQVFRPANAAEALVCLDLSLRRATGPSVLMLSDTPPPTMPDAQGCARGGYVVREPDSVRDLTIIAAGPELAVALEAAALLAGDEVAVSVVSLPSWEVFAAQGSAYRNAVLGEAPRLGLESGSGFGWERHLGTMGIFVGPRDGVIVLSHVLKVARSLLPCNRALSAAE